jgi:penicillin amidase
MNVSRWLFGLLLGRRLPITSGTLKVPGVTRPVIIRRDEYGIPYIEAENDGDAWYSLGFCQGQDRAFQIETQLRVVCGTLAEVVGSEAIPIDRISRRIGFRHAAVQQLECLDDDVRRVLEAFARGVTDGVRLGCRRQAHEFTLLRAKPSPYLAADIFGMVKLMSFMSMSGNWDVELARLKILTEDGVEALVALDTAYAEWLPVTAPPGALAGRALDRLAEDLAIFTAAIGHGSGSNNWVIAPSRTAAGRVILANDPHLTPSLPPHWYLAHVRTPNWAIAGACMAGTPAFPAGHNGTAAWGVTDGCVDSTDLFVEEIGPDGRSVREGERFVPCEVRPEVIRVKGGAAIREEVVVTKRGPIISPALEGEVRALSLCATWLAPRPGEGFIQLYRTHTFEEFRHAFEHWPFASYNMVYGDTSGTIGWQLIGETPQRRQGWGTIPLPGWEPEVGWEVEPVPFDKMPYLANPEAGFIATTNNKPIQEDAGLFLGIDWIEGYRQARVVEVLDARRDWDLPDVQALQMDQKSMPWPEIRNIVLSLPGETEEVQEALALLGAWDGRVAADSPAATVFEFFLAEITKRVVAAKAPRTARYALGEAGFTPLYPFSSFLARRVGHLVRLLREQPEGWLEQSWTQEMVAALTIVIKNLRTNYGERSDKWAWGRIRPLVLKHLVGERAPLNKVFNLGPFPWGGDANTVGQGGGYISDTTSNPLVIASLRMVVDVGNWENNRFALPGGQSGNPLSPHYRDLLPFWQRGEGVPIAWSPEETARVARSVLRLIPMAVSGSAVGGSS